MSEAAEFIAEARQWAARNGIGAPTGPAAPTPFDRTPLDVPDDAACSDDDVVTALLAETERRANAAEQRCAMLDAQLEVLKGAAAALDGSAHNAVSSLEAELVAQQARLAVAHARARDAEELVVILREGADALKSQLEDANRTINLLQADTAAAAAVAASHPTTTDAAVSTAAVGELPTVAAQTDAAAAMRHAGTATHSPAARADAGCSPRLLQPDELPPATTLGSSTFRTFSSSGGGGGGGGCAESFTNSNEIYFRKDATALLAAALREIADLRRQQAMLLGALDAIPSEEGEEAVKEMLPPPPEQQQQGQEEYENERGLPAARAWHNDPSTTNRRNTEPPRGQHNQGQQRLFASEDDYDGVDYGGQGGTCGNNVSSATLRPTHQSSRQQSGTSQPFGSTTRRQAALASSRSAATSSPPISQPLSQPSRLRPSREATYSPTTFLQPSQRPRIARRERARSLTAAAAAAGTGPPAPFFDIGGSEGRRAVPSLRRQSSSSTTASPTVGPHGTIGTRYPSSSSSSGGGRGRGEGGLGASGGWEEEPRLEQDSTRVYGEQTSTSGHFAASTHKQQTRGGCGDGGGSNATALAAVLTLSALDLEIAREAAAAGNVYDSRVGGMGKPAYALATDDSGPPRYDHGDETYGYSDRGAGDYSDRGAGSDRSGGDYRGASNSSSEESLRGDPVPGMRALLRLLDEVSSSSSSSSGTGDGDGDRGMGGHPGMTSEVSGGGGGSGSLDAAGLAACFAAVDLAHTGRIDADQFCAALELYEPRLPPHSILHALWGLHLQDARAIDHADFVAALDQLRRRNGGAGGR